MRGVTVQKDADDADTGIGSPTRKKVLCLVQLPPPVHGAAVMNAHIVDKVLPESGFSYSIINLDFSQSFEGMHGGSLRKAAIAGKILFRVGC